MTAGRGHIRLVAVLDVGKTNVKAVLHDLSAEADLQTRTMPNRVRQDGLYPHFDTDAIQSFFLDALADFVRQDGEPVDAISVTTHGAAGALLGAEDLALPVLDYEYDAPGLLAESYERVRPGFSETCSPRLPGGLNLGAQLFWQMRTFPDAFERAETFLTYPQYWSWWLTGVRAIEPTSLGAHTDLWDPRGRTLSSLVGKAGWTSRMPPLRSAYERLGMLKADVARRIGLDRPVPVLCGIHDSNAALLPHIQAGTVPLSVVSTGTWVILFALGGALDHLDPDRDTLANVDVFARPVPSARFMGGREFDLIAGTERPVPDAATVARVVERGLMVLPTLVPGNGPFPNARGRWSAPADTLAPAERVAVASLYAALMTSTCLDVLGAEGPTVVEGPFGRNELYLDALAALTGRPVLQPQTAAGTSSGAAKLVLMADPCDGPGGAAPPRDLPPRSRRHVLGDAFRRYVQRWRAEAETAG